METFHYLFGHSADAITWWQMCGRAVVIFAWAVLLYRIMPRRAFGSSAIGDIVVVVILGSSLSRALTGSAPLIPVMAATATLAVLYWMLSGLSRRYNVLSRLAKGRAALLISNGQVDRQALRRHELGENDLAESLRLHGIEDVGDVGTAYLERNGQISAIKKR